ncbi:MAG: DUF6261 family protein [Fibromonadaceae bacterium]|jgi:flagellar biosynthesis chaperone FliJ|nr:DUF6261 family protein [Fibromonadaceae bacterium]
MKIQSLKTHNLRNDAHFQFHTEFRNMVAKHGAATLKIKPQYDSYLPLYDREDEALKKIVKSEFTAKIHEADKARDDIYIGMVEMNTAALKHFSPQIREAATRLKIVFDTYGKVAQKPLNEETSAIYNILQELNGKYTEDVSAVGIGQWVSELEARNNAFEKLVVERFDEAAAKTDIVLKDARAQLDAVYFAMRERLNALVVVEGVADYEVFIKTLNVVIAKYAVKHHKHSHNAEPELENSQNNQQNGESL